MTNTVPTQIQTLSPEDRQAAADLLDEAYLEGDPVQIEAAHRLLDDLQGIGNVAIGETPNVIHLPSGRARKSDNHPYGGLRRVSVTSGRMDPSHGVPKSWHSPEERP
jgi:hypothetical protein